jgi:carlactone synthase/all-trans-10'-apo-beta-carotenal 13,14-cleaving dioxygenase
MASSFCVFAAMSGAAAGRPGSGAAAVPGRLATTSQGAKGKRAAAQPLAASVVTETPTPVIAPVPVPPARPVVDAPPRRRGGRGAGEHAAWKSVRQERWEGALEVEGELPLWLVGTPLHRLF